MKSKTTMQGERCPSCNYNIEANTPIKNGSVPSEGGLCVCFNCGEILIFNKDLSKRKITYDELKGLDEKSFFIVTRLSESIKRDKPLKNY